METILKRSFIIVNSMYHWNTAVSEVSTLSSLLYFPFSGGVTITRNKIYISLARHLYRVSFSLKEFFELLHTQVLQWHIWMTKCVFNCSSRSCDKISNLRAILDRYIRRKHILTNLLEFINIMRATCEMTNCHLCKIYYQRL